MRDICFKMQFTIIHLDAYQVLAWLFQQNRQAFLVFWENNITLMTMI